MRLISVVSARATATPGVLIVTARVEAGRGPEDIPVTFNPEETGPLTSAIANWMDQNPGLPIEHDTASPA